MRFRLTLWILLALTACGRFGFDAQDTGNALADMGAADVEVGVRDLGPEDALDAAPVDLGSVDAGDVAGTDLGDAGDASDVIDSGDAGDPLDVGGAGDEGVQELGPADAPDTGLGTRTITLRCSEGGSVLISGCTATVNQPCEIRAQIGTNLRIQASPSPGFAYARTTGPINSFQANGALEVAQEDSEYHVDFIGIRGAAEANLGPISLSRNNESFQNVQVVPEATFTSGSSIVIDVQIPHTLQRVSGTAFQGRTVIPSGLRLHSYLLHFAPTAAGATASATVSFPNPVLGLITLGAGLTATDSLVQRNGISYSNSTARGGLEADSADLVHLHGDRKTLYFRNTSFGVDQIRVLTLNRPQARLPLMLSDGAVRVAAPASVLSGDSESNDVQYIEERRTVMPVSTAVDVADPGRYEELSDYVSAVPQAGQDLSSVLLHFDPPGITIQLASAAITFDRPILGVYSESSSLNAGDSAFGNPQIMYPGQFSGRGAHLLGTDFLLIGEDRQTIFFVVGSDLGTEQFRVLLKE